MLLLIQSVSREGCTKGLDLTFKAKFFLSNTEWRCSAPERDGLGLVTLCKWIYMVLEDALPPQGAICNILQQ